VEDCETAVLGTTENLQLEMPFRKQAEIAQGLQSSWRYNLSLHLWVYALFYKCFMKKGENYFGETEVLQARADGR